MREPQRSLMKPELVWQYEKGLQLTHAEVILYVASCFLSSHTTSARHVGILSPSYGNAFSRSI